MRRASASPDGRVVSTIRAARCRPNGSGPRTLDQPQERRSRRRGDPFAGHTWSRLRVLDRSAAPCWFRLSEGAPGSGLGKRLACCASIRRVMAVGELGSPGRHDERATGLFSDELLTVVLEFVAAAQRTMNKLLSQLLGERNRAAGPAEKRGAVPWPLVGLGDGSQSGGVVGVEMAGCVAPTDWGCG